MRPVGAATAAYPSALRKAVMVGGVVTGRGSSDLLLMNRAQSSRLWQVELRARIGGNEIQVVGVTRDVPANERAIRQHCDPSASHLVERVTHQDRCETSTGETRVDLGMGEGVPVPLGAVDGEACK